MNYAQQAHKPEWYKVDDTKLHYAATLGSSPLNEWYEFEDRAEAVEFLTGHLPHKRFCWVDEEIWDTDYVYRDHDTDQWVLLLEQPADIQVMIEAVSKFY
jgi:hypothetical protein